MTWLMSDKEGHTVGECCLDEVEKDRYSLNDGATANLKIYNMGLMLHSSYQNRGIATQLAKLLLSHLDEMNNVKECGIDALLISVRPNDVKMNSFAKKLNFEFEKNVNIRVEGLLPCVSVTNIPNSLYLKRLSPTV